MDIKLPLTLEQRPTATQLEISPLNLKLNQQLDVKVISVKTEAQSLVVNVISSNKPLHIQSDQAITIKPGETLNLVVSKLTPTVEFKVLDSSDQKLLKINDLVFKSINTPEQTKAVTTNVKTFSSVTPTIITAKIIAIDNDSIQLKLDTSPLAKVNAYSKSNQLPTLQQQNPIITLSKEQLISTELQSLGTKIQPTLAKISEFKLGQNLQLEVNKAGINPEFKIITEAKLSIKQGDVLTATIIEVENNKIKLGFSQKQSPAVNSPIKLAVIPITDKQISFSSESLQTKPVLQSLKPNQQLLVEVKKTGSQVEFKVIDVLQPKVQAGQTFKATVIGFNNNQVQFQLPDLPAETIINDKKLLATKQLVTDKPSTNLSNLAKTVTNNASPVSASPSRLQTQTLLPSSTVISLTRQQLTTTTGPQTKDLGIQPDSLKLGQHIQLKAVKVADQIEFKLEQASNIQQLKIIDTVKQLYPLQEPPSELVNQLMQKLSAINKNEKVPDALKRLAKEILDSIPELKDIKNDKQIKKLMSQSGLFLEAKLAQSLSNNNSTLPPDFKNLLLKFQQAIKQEIEVNKDNKSQTAEINLMKEMQQKTESSLAKLILNQLASLPKDDTPRQVWHLDFPFLNQEKAETVRLEIDKEQQQNNEEDSENWSVNVTITPPGLSTIHCKISYSNETINTQFSTENEDVVQKINQNLGYLKMQFEKSGLNTGHVSVNKGSPLPEVCSEIKGQTLFDQKV